MIAPKFILQALGVENVLRFDFASPPPVRFAATYAFFSRAFLVIG
jgi:hypothetical protein